MKRSNSSMQLTRAADYAVRVMIHLAGQATESRALLPTLAQATDAPESFLSKVLQALSHAGLISSRRGQSGGFQISALGRAASMREVIQAQMAMMEVLSAATITDLATQTQPIELAQRSRQSKS
jgi:Rrf2 family protein